MSPCLASEMMEFLSTVYFRFIVCGVSMAVIGAVLVYCLSILQVSFFTYLFMCAVIYLAVSLLNYLIQINWVFKKKGYIVNYLLCSVFCSLLFGYLNAKIYFIIEEKILFSSLVSYISSMLLVTPISFLLNKSIFRYDRT